jgi:hypothetical protein
MTWLLVLCSWFPNFAIASPPVHVADDDFVVREPHDCHEFFICPQMRMRKVNVDGVSGSPLIDDFKMTGAIERQKMQQSDKIPVKRVFAYEPSEAWKDATKVVSHDNDTQRSICFGQFPCDSGGVLARAKSRPRCPRPSLDSSGHLRVNTDVTHFSLMLADVLLIVFQVWLWVLKSMYLATPWIWGQRLTAPVAHLAGIGTKMCKTATHPLRVAEAKQVDLASTPGWPCA